MSNKTYARIKPKMNVFAADLKAFCAKHDLDYKKLRVVTDMFGGVKFTLQTLDKLNTNAPKKHVADWEARCGEFGLKQEWLGKSLTFSNAGTYKIVGLLPRKRKNKVLLENANGKQASCTVASVKFLIKDVA